MKLMDLTALELIIAELKKKLNIADSAESAKKLATPRNINGIPFDGTQDITIKAEATVFDPEGKLNYPNGTKEWIE